MDGLPAVAKGGWFQGPKAKVVVMTVAVAALLLLAGVGVGVGMGVKRHNDHKHKNQPTGTTVVPASSPTPAANTTIGSNTSVATPRLYCTVPEAEPHENQTQILQSNDTKMFVDYLLGHASYYVGIDDTTVQVLQHKLRYLLVQYLQDCRIDKVANVVRQLPDARADSPGAFKQRIAQEMAAVFDEFESWLAGDAQNISALTPSQVDALRAFQGEVDAFNAASAPELNSADPVQQLALCEARLEQYGIVLGRDTNSTSSGWLMQLAAGARQLKADNATNTSSQYNLGLANFPRAKIGIVFHALQYEGNMGRLHPRIAYQDGSLPAEQLVAQVNGYYALSGTNLEFYIQEYRYNVTQYPYLKFGGSTAWLSCADNATCLCNVAKEHNMQPTRYVNIYIAGSFSSGNSDDGYSSTVPYQGDVCSNKPKSWNQALAGVTQHLWVVYDVLDAAYSEGAATLSHELGHLLGGLVHTHDDKSPNNCNYTDYVADTPPNLNVQAAWDSSSNPNDRLLYSWCAELMDGMKPDTTALERFDSCRGDKFVDNVFNIMSYTPPPCNLYFTVGQVRRLQTIAARIHKDMLIPV